MTTVSVSPSNHRKLKKLKEDLGAKSIDEVISRFLQEEDTTPDVEDMFGSGEVKDWSKIRDREDRADR